LGKKGYCSKIHICHFNTLICLVFLFSYAGEIASTADGWQRFGIYTGGEDDDFAFYPRLFAKPLREGMEAELQIKEMMSHSQLFIEFVAEKRRIWKSRQEMASGEVGKFIAEWIYEQRMMRKLS
jgi:hypothetical protein